MESIRGERDLRGKRVRMANRNSRLQYPWPVAQAELSSRYRSCRSGMMWKTAELHQPTKQHEWNHIQAGCILLATSLRQHWEHYRNTDGQCCAGERVWLWRMGYTSCLGSEGMNLGLRGPLPQFPGRRGSPLGIPPLPRQSYKKQPPVPVQIPQGDSSPTPIPRLPPPTDTTLLGSYKTRINFRCQTPKEFQGFMGRKQEPVVKW